MMFSAGCGHAFHLLRRAGVLCCLANFQLAHGSAPPQSSPSLTHLAASAAPQTEMTTSISLPELALSLAMILGGILLFAGLLRYLGRLQVHALGGLRVVGGLSVGMRERIILVRAGDTHILVGIAPGYLRTLHVFEHAPGASTGLEDEATNFTARLKKAMQGHA